MKVKWILRTRFGDGKRVELSQDYVEWRYLLWAVFNFWDLLLQ